MPTVKLNTSTRNMRRTMRDRQINRQIYSERKKKRETETATTSSHRRYLMWMNCIHFFEFVLTYYRWHCVHVHSPEPNRNYIESEIQEYIVIFMRSTHFRYYVISCVIIFPQNKTQQQQPWNEEHYFGIAKMNRHNENNSCINIGNIPMVILLLFGTVQVLTLNTLTLFTRRIYILLLQFQAQSNAIIHSSTD